MKKTLVLAVAALCLSPAVMAANLTCNDIVGFWGGPAKTDLGNLNVDVKITSPNVTDGSGTVYYNTQWGPVRFGALNGACKIVNGVPQITLSISVSAERASYTIKLVDAHTAQMTGQDEVTTFHSSTLTK